MRAFFIVLKFELETMLKKKSFLISTILVAIAAFALLSFPRFLSNDSENKDTQKVDKVMIIQDMKQILQDDNLIKQQFPAYKILHTTQLDELKKQVTDGKADIGFAINDATHFTYYVKNSSLQDTRPAKFEDLMKKQYQAKEFKRYRYDAATIEAIYQTPIQSETTVLGTDGSSNYYYTYALILLLYMMIMIYGNQVGVGVASEKSNRAIEILTTSTTSNTLIFGKVIAGAITGVLQTALMLGSFLLAYQVNADVWNHALDKFLHIPSIVLWTFTLFGMLGYLLFNFLFGAIGALCSKVEEVNGATMPIQLLIIAVFILSYVSLQMPDTLLAKIVGFVPFTSWMCMFINVAVVSATVWEIIISWCLLAVTTIAMGILGARLYRRGTLSYGNTVSLKTIVQALRHNE